jgi:hypothetical protein
MEYLSPEQKIAQRIVVRGHDFARIRHAMTDNLYEHVIYATFVRVLSYKEGSALFPNPR